MKNSFLKWIFLLIIILFLCSPITFENKHCSEKILYVLWLAQASQIRTFVENYNRVKEKYWESF